LGLNFRPWQLPFVTLSGRSDRTLVFYAANIYPEHVQLALNEKSFLNKLTGKFVLEKQRTRSMDQKLMIHIELMPNIHHSAALARHLERSIERTLKHVNTEYADTCAHSEKDLSPHVRLHPYQHRRYFQPGLKPRYIL
jgi:phenylacetate-CoA ligase